MPKDKETLNLPGSRSGGLVGVMKRALTSSPSDYLFEVQDLNPSSMISGKRSPAELREAVVNTIMGTLRSSMIVEGRKAFSAGSQPPLTKYERDPNRVWKKWPGSRPSRSRGDSEDPNAIQRLLRYPEGEGRYVHEQ